MDFDNVLTGKILKIVVKDDKASSGLFLISRVKKNVYTNPDLVKYQVFGVRLDTQESHGILASFKEEEVSKLSTGNKVKQSVHYTDHTFSFVD
jgi:hypothetical protein